MMFGPASTMAPASAYQPLQQQQQAAYPAAAGMYAQSSYGQQQQQQQQQQHAAMAYSNPAAAAAGVPYPTTAGAGQLYEKPVAAPQLAASSGVCRSSWTYWPPTKAEASQMEVPLGLVFNPFAEGQQLQVVNYEPVRCRQSGCILNPACHVDYRAKVWVDPFSTVRNSFPPNYAAQLTEANVPAELVNSSIEYVLPNVRNTGAPTYFFVIDVNLYEEELDALKDSLQQVLTLLPPEASVGIITFGTVVHIHELGFSECIKTYVFRGTKIITQADIQQQLKLGAAKPKVPAPNQQQTPAQLPSHRFIATLADSEYIIQSILDDLLKDTWPVPSDNRAARCTGAALSAAVSLMELCAHQAAGRILLFVGGLCTTGPGQIVGTSLSENIRQHIDLQKESANAKYSKSAIKFYSELAARAGASGHAIDLFCCALDQCGLHEMKVCAERTGGIVVMSDTFSLNVFRDSLRKLFETSSDGTVHDAFNCKIELLTSKEVKIAGAVGCVTSNNKKGPQVADLQVGQSGTCEWVAGVMDRNSTVAFYLEVVNSNAANVKNRLAHLQFQVTYTHPNGTRRIRVHTLAFPFAEGGIAHVGSGFDQEAATALMARLAVGRAETEEPLDILRWVDRKLIRLVSVFADYQKDKPETFQLGSEFAYYPTFMYHLRRSNLLQTFNASPDETAYYRVCLLRETLANTVTMISPCLQEYSLNHPGAAAVELDSKALKPDVILLLDSFFYLVIWHGEQIARWKEQGYHEMDKYRNLKLLIEAPLEDAKAILTTRLPCPKFVSCNAGGSQARFLLAKVNPSSTHSQMLQEYGGEAVGTSILTEDVNMKTFMDHLIKLAVSP